MSSEELGAVENPQKWRFTWEAQSHIPTLRLFLFDSCTNPALQCRNLQVHVNLSLFLVLVAWSDDSVQVSLRVPIPRVLVDAESPVNFRAFDDHIEVKLVLLLPVGHPLVSNFDEILNSSGNEETVKSDSLKSLSVDADIKSLSSCGGVHFYCRSCEFNLTRSPLGEFVEMPSINWREVADNWFGACCCSFGGISEKLVTRFANSYACAKGVCLLSFATITVCKDDLVGCNFPESSKGLSHEAGAELSGESEIGKSTLNSNAHNEKVSYSKHEDEELSANVASVVTDEECNNERLSHLKLELDSTGNNDLAKGCCGHHVSETLIGNQKLAQSVDIMENQKPFLNGFLGNIFMVKSANLSSDVEWVEFLCPQCSTLLGAYPRGDGSAPVDGGVRLFKCYIATSLPIGGSRDLFRKYTLERMFTSQLLDFAKDELSYRTVVRDLKTKIPMLLIVIVNTNSWSCTGYCLSTQSSTEAVPKLDLHPVIKVLFTEGGSKTESEARDMEDRIKKDLADEVFMLRHQIEDVFKSLVSAKNILPPSWSSLQGLSLSSMQM